MSTGLSPAYGYLKQWQQKQLSTGAWAPGPHGPGREVMRPQSVHIFPAYPESLTFPPLVLRACLLSEDSMSSPGGL